MTDGRIWDTGEDKAMTTPEETLERVREIADRQCETEKDMAILICAIRDLIGRPQKETT